MKKKKEKVKTTEKVESTKDRLVRELAEWQAVYDEEMGNVNQYGATEIINGSHAMSAHLKSANLAQQNMIRIRKMLDGGKGDKNDNDEFNDFDI